MTISIKGHNTILQTISIDDANDICVLRNDPLINRYLSSSEPISLEEQKCWLINNQKNRGELYLKILDSSNLQMCGTISIYQINQNSGEFGRYICTKSVQAIEAEWLLIRFCFEIMRLDSIFCRTAFLNTKVWKQHYAFGFTDESTELLQEKDLLLKRQSLSKETYRKFDYSKISNLIERIKK
jgi:RimJ/RimL family protein N-acetyltransferase